MKRGDESKQEPNRRPSFSKDRELNPRLSDDRHGSDDDDDDVQAEAAFVRRKSSGPTVSRRRPPPPQEARVSREEMFTEIGEDDDHRPTAFRPRTLSKGLSRDNVRERSNSREETRSVPRSSAWADNQPKVVYGEEFEKENERKSRPVTKWNAAKPASERDTSPDSSETPARSDNTDEEERDMDEDSDDSDVIKNPKCGPSKYSDFIESEESSGKTFPRRSGRYDEDETTEIPPSTLRDTWNSTESRPTMVVPYVLKAHPRGSRTEHVQCLIVRDRGSIQSKMYPTYELILEDSKKKLIVATKMNLNRTSNYHLFDMTRGQAGSKLSKKSGNYLGKLRAKDMNRSQYVLVTHASEREEMAGIVFDRLGIVNQLKEGSQPRKMMVVVPHLDSNKVPIANRVKENGDGSMVDKLRSGTSGNQMLTFESKDPVYENGNYRLNFNGRVSVPSVKNFQLVSRDDIDNVVCQFGKIGEDRFHLDFKSPLNAFQAFALALCQFNL